MKYLNILSMSTLLYFFGYSRTDTTYYSNNQIEVIESFDKNDKRHGKRTMYYKNGQLASISFWKHDERDSSFITWHENGLMETKAFIKQGKSHSWQCDWDSLGYPVDSSYFNMGKRIEQFIFFPESRKIHEHLYFYYPPSGPGNTVFWEEGVETGKRHLVMKDQFNPKGELISQIRNGNGIEYDIRMNGRYVGFQVYRNGVWDYNNYTSLKHHPKDPRHKRVPIPKSKHIPWDVNKYGKIDVPDKAE